MSVQVNHIQVATLGAGSFFGEMSLLSNERRSATVSAIKDTTCLVLSRADFQEHLGPLEEVSILDINILYHGITSCMVVQNIATLEFISCTVFLWCVAERALSSAIHILHREIFFYYQNVVFPNKNRWTRKRGAEKRLLCAPKGTAAAHGSCPHYAVFQTVCSAPHLLPHLRRLYLAQRVWAQLRSRPPPKQGV